MTLAAIETAAFSIVSLIGVGGIAWFVKLAIGKSLDHLLEKKLADFKHVQSQEIANLNNKLHHLEDRGVRSNEREYEAIVSAWEGFIDAYHATFSAMGGFRQRPDLKAMSDTEISEWLDTTDISQMNKEFILKSYDKNQALSGVERARELFDCQQALWNAQQIIRYKAVFIPEKIEKHFDEAMAVLRTVWSENQVNFGSPGALPLTQTIKFLEDDDKPTESVRAKLRDIVRKRVLHSS